MVESIANLPSSISSVIQLGLLDLDILEALEPVQLWRELYAKHQHMGRGGETLTMTRDGLIPPGNKASALRIAGQDPATLQRSVEQFSYRIFPYGGAIDTHLPSSFVAQSSRFRSDIKQLMTHAGLTLGRIARDAMYAAYGGRNSFATSAAGSPTTTLPVQDATGFDTAVPVGQAQQPVSVSNPLAITVTGVANTVVACDLVNNILTLGTATTWAQYDAVVGVDAPTIVRATSRATDRLIVAGDTPLLATFRNAATVLRNANVPGIDGVVGSLYGCYVDADVENVLFADPEIRTAMAAQAITGIFSAGIVGVYAGIQFMRMPKTESLIIPQGGAIQTPIHRSIVFGEGPGIEAYIPEAEFAGEVAAGGIPEAVATTVHYKKVVDDKGVISLVVRAPLDKAGEVVSSSWLANTDYCIPTDSLGISGPQRVKRACIVHTAGPA